jgi:hypothetical protein
MWNIQYERLPRTKTATHELPPPHKASVVKAVLSGVWGRKASMPICRGHSATRTAER